MNKTIALCVCWLSVAHNAIAQQADALASESNAWAVSLNGAAECLDCLTGANYSFTVRSKLTGGNGALTVETLAKEMTSVAVYEDVGVFVGELPSGGRSVSLYELNTGGKIAEFYSYDLHASPDGRYLIYRKFFPRFSSEASTSLMVYDLEMEIGEQRRLFASMPPAEVGFQFHPVPPAIVPEFSLSSILWKPELGKAFLIVVDESGYYNLLTMPLWEDRSLADGVNTCYIPFAPLTNESVHALDVKKNTVESLELVDQTVEVELFEVNGIATSFRINYQSHCP